METISGTGGSTAWYELRGPILMALSGTIGGGTATLEVKGGDGSTAIAVDGQARTAIGAYFVDMPENTRRQFRVTLASATGAALVVSLTD